MAVILHIPPKSKYGLWTCCTNPPTHPHSWPPPPLHYIIMKKELTYWAKFPGVSRGSVVKCKDPPRFTVSWEKGKLYIKTIACLLYFTLCPGDSLRAGNSWKNHFGENSSLLGSSVNLRNSSLLRHSVNLQSSSLLGFSWGAPEELLTPQAFPQPPELLTPGVLLGNFSLLKRSLNLRNSHSWDVPWELGTPRVFPYSKPGVTNKGGNIIVP
jgi:hypothetical protein